MRWNIVKAPPRTTVQVHDDPCEKHSSKSASAQEFPVQIPPRTGVTHKAPLCAARVAENTAARVDAQASDTKTAIGGWYPRFGTLVLTGDY